MYDLDNTFKGGGLKYVKRNKRIYCEKCEISD